jgi:hypothetical protein
VSIQYERVADLAKALSAVRASLAWPLEFAPSYLVTDTGHIISLIKKKPHVMAPTQCGKYKTVRLKTSNGSYRTCYIHQLVLMGFNGARPEKYQAAHLDGNSENNRLENLAWTSTKENAYHRVLHGTSGKGEQNAMAKLTQAQVNEMRRIRQQTGQTYKQIAEQFGVAAMTAFRAIKGESWN